MKGSGTLVASLFAASTVAFSSSSSSSSSSASASAAGDSDISFNPTSNEVIKSSSSRKGGIGSNVLSASDKEKFAPRFDGLRFIETLVTAHR